MYLILKTQVNGGAGEDPQSECAVIEIEKETLDYWAGMMDQAAQVSAKLGKAITLSFDDWTPKCYAGLPTHPAFTPEDEEALEECEPGYCWMDERPFPEYTASHSEESWVAPPAAHEPVQLSYCQMFVSANVVYWQYGPKYGDVEEYTHALARKDCADLYETLNGIVD